MNKTETWKIVLLSMAGNTLLWLILGLGLMAWAENSELDSGPRAIPYNGLLEFNGASFTGQADVQFTLTDDGNCTFTEDHEEVRVFAGRFSVNIGQPTGDLPACLFNADAVYLEMAVRSADDDNPHVALAGRQRINPVPFSYWAAEGSDFRVDGLLRADSATIPTITGDTTINGDTTLNGTTTVDDRLNVAGDAGQIRFTADEFDRNADVGEFSDFKLLLYPGSEASRSYGFGIQGGTLFANSDSEFDFKIDGADEFNLTASDATFNTNLSATGALSAASANITGNLTAGTLNAGTTTLGTTTLGTTTVNATDINIGNNPGRGNGGRAIVHNAGDTLALNFAGDFSGGVQVQSNLSVTGSVTSAQGTLFNVPCNVFDRNNVQLSTATTQYMGGAPMDGRRRLDFYCQNGVITRIDFRY